VSDGLVTPLCLLTRHNGMDPTDFKIKIYVFMFFTKTFQFIAQLFTVFEAMTGVSDNCDD
jgi:hypothetical protein